MVTLPLPVALMLNTGASLSVLFSGVSVVVVDNVATFEVLVDGRGVVGVQISYKISININIFSQNPTDGIVPLLAIERG